MGINSTLYREAMPFLDEYHCPPGELAAFFMITWDFLTRQEQAIKVIERIMMAHGKEDLLRYVVELARIEHGIRELEPWVRDHVVHALLSFVLGICVNERMLRPAGLAVDHFQWKLAGLFHDVGYPAQVAKDILRAFTDKINMIRRDFDVGARDIFFRIAPVGLEELTNEVCGLELIQQWLDRWGLVINAADEYGAMVESGNICHGMISSLAVLNVIDIMYQKHNPAREYRDIYYPPGINWSQSYFENAVVPACSAIFVHNLPARCFAPARIDRTRAALPFLLRLSDCLQDWDRPSAEEPEGIPDDMFQIDLAPGRLVCIVNDPDRRSKIADEIASSLVAMDIDIQG